MTENASLFLEIISPNQPVRRAPLDAGKGIANIGSHPANEIVLDSPGIAEFHAILDYRETPYKLIMLAGVPSAQAGGPAPINELVLHQPWQLGQFLLILHITALSAPNQPAIDDSTNGALTQSVGQGADIDPFMIAQFQERSPKIEDDIQEEFIQIDAPERNQIVNVNQTAAWTMIVTNSGSRTARIDMHLYIRGKNQAWVEVKPAPENGIQLQPEQPFRLNDKTSRSVTIKLTPPRGTRAGWYHFQVRAVSPDYLESKGSYVEVALHVRPYDSFAIDPPDPATLRIKFRGRHQGWLRGCGLNYLELGLSNYSNRELLLDVEGREVERRCRIEFGTPYLATTEQKGKKKSCDEIKKLFNNPQVAISRISAPPHQKYIIPVRVTPVRAYRLGRGNRTYQLRFTLAPENERGITYDPVKVEHAPLMRWWVFIPFLFLALFALLVGALWLLQPKIKDLKLTQSGGAPKLAGYPADLAWNANTYLGQMQITVGSSLTDKQLLFEDLDVRRASSDTISTTLQISETYTITVENIVAQLPIVGDKGLQWGKVSQTHTLTNLLPGLTVEPVSAPESEGMITFTVRLSAPTAQTVMVAYKTITGLSAVEKSDYEPITQKNLILSPGSLIGFIPVTITTDSTVENDDEKFLLELTNAQHALLVDQHSSIQDRLLVTGTIAGDKESPTLAVQDAFALDKEGEMTFTVTLSNRTQQVVTATYETRDDSARAGVDYTTTIGEITISPQEKQAVIQVPIKENKIADNDKTFSLFLLESNHVISDGQALGRIQDDEGQPILTILDARANEGDRLLTFIVTLSMPSAQQTTVAFATADDSATTTDNDFVATSGVLEIPAGELSTAIQVEVREDDKAEGNESLKIRLSEPSSNIAIEQNGEATGLIVDNDSMPLLSISDASANEQDRLLNFEIKLTNPIQQIVTVDYNTVENTAKPGSDYEGKGGVLQIPAGQTTGKIEIVVINDLEAGEAEEKLTVRLSNPQNAVLSDSEAIGIITDNDAIPTTTSTPTTTPTGTPAPTLTPTITPAPVNSAPNVQDDNAITVPGMPVVVPVLSNDTDPDGDTLRLENIDLAPLNGSANINSNGTITYISNPNFTGIDSFIYTASDGKVASNAGTVTITVFPNGTIPQRLQK